MSFQSKFANFLRYNALSRLLPDRIFLELEYFLYFGKKLNLKNPVLYNEKIQWLKLYHRKPEHPGWVDKYEVREYIAKTIGEEYLIPCYGAWDSFDEIPFDKLPNEFVLKCTHDSHTVIVCKDKKSLDMPKMRKYFNSKMKRNFYYRHREWVYKDLKPRIIAEKLMVDESGVELKDYKIYCFNGEPKTIEVIFDRFTEEAKENFYSPEWEYQALATSDFVAAPNVNIEKPKCLDRMLDLAKKLSAGEIHIRVDLYVIMDKIYFGELTFYNSGGFEHFKPSKWNKIFGDWITL